MNNIKDVYGSDLARRILIWIRHGAHKPTQISGNIDESNQLVSKYLRSLEDENLIERSRDGRSVFCSLTEKGERLSNLSEEIYWKEKKVEELKEADTQ